MLATLAARYSTSVDQVESTLTVRQIELHYYFAMRDRARETRWQTEAFAAVLIGGKPGG